MKLINRHSDFLHSTRDHLQGGKIQRMDTLKSIKLNYRSNRTTAQN